MKNLSECRVLLMDDAKANLDLLVEGLKADHKLSLAMNGEPALQVAARTPPDLVLLGIMMPGLDGYAFVGDCSRCRRRRKCRSCFCRRWKKCRTRRAVRGSSAGLRAFSATLKERGGQASFIHMQPQIQEVFEIMKSLPGVAVFKDMAKMDRYLAARQRDHLKP